MKSAETCSALISSVQNETDRASTIELLVSNTSGIRSRIEGPSRDVGMKSKARSRTKKTSRRRLCEIGGAISSKNDCKRIDRCRWCFVKHSHGYIRAFINYLQNLNRALDFAGQLSFNSLAVRLALS